jgi:hypothetical protein
MRENATDLWYVQLSYLHDCMPFNDYIYVKDGNILLRGKLVIRYIVYKMAFLFGVGLFLI